MTIRSLLCLIVFAAHGLLPALAQSQDRFNYNRTVGNNYGPKNWGKITCANKDTCPGWPTNYEELSPWIQYDTNTCKDCATSRSGECFEHRQSPIALWKNVTKTTECIDIHKMGYVKGDCPFEETKFKILPHVLRVEWPLSCGTVTPQIDFSRGFPDPWNMRFMDISVPSQHTLDGKRYPAEITLSHTYSVDKTDKRKFIGNVNILLDVGTDANHNSFFELFLSRFETMAADIKLNCDSRRKLGQLKEEESESSEHRSLRQHQPRKETSESQSKVDETTDESHPMERRLYQGEFHPYVWYDQTGTQYYFRYRGSWVEPPCLEDLTAFWRVLKNPVKISPSQYSRLDRIFYQRLNPDTCVPESAGKLRSGSSEKRDFNRPTQTTTVKHELMYCECVDFNSPLPNDVEYCSKSLSQRGVFPHQG